MTATNAKEHRAEARRHALVLAAIAVLTFLAWRHPIGQRALYPFTLLATYAHEMGHGLTALFLGGEFNALHMHADGSGLAEWRGNFGRVARAMVAAGGLVGPSVAGAIVLVLSRKKRSTRIALAVLGVTMALSALFFARNLFSLAFISLSAAVLLGIALRAPAGASAWVLQIVGVQLCLSVFRDLDYMFSDGGLVGGEMRRSDSAAIAEALLLPYWFWGALVAALSFAVLAAGLYVALRSPPYGPEPHPAAK